MSSVMIFSSETALDYFLKNGFVYTLRKKKQNTGKVWITNKRGGKKICDAYREHMGRIVYIDAWPHIEAWLINRVKFAKLPVTGIERRIYLPLIEYVKHSGFYSLRGWFEEVKRLNGGEIPKELHLYRVKKWC